MDPHGNYKSVRLGDGQNGENIRNAANELMYQLFKKKNSWMDPGFAANIIMKKQKIFAIKQIFLDAMEGAKLQFC